jgi:hypothetical protein
MINQEYILEFTRHFKHELKDKDIDKIKKKLFFIHKKLEKSDEEKIDFLEFLRGNVLNNSLHKSLYSSLEKLKGVMGKVFEMRSRNFKKVYKKKTIIKKKEKKKKIVAEKEVQEKKNRPGQRARREKWEKKYGENANHLKKSKKVEITKSKKEESRKEEKHPSWDARIKKREMEEKLIKSRGKGTKILF